LNPFVFWPFVLQVLQSAVLAAFRERKDGCLAVSLLVSEAAVALDHFRRHANLVLNLQCRRATLPKLNYTGGAQPMEGGTG
jgi:hypothetical protein